MIVDSSTSKLEFGDVKNVLFCTTSFGFGPVSKLLSVAEGLSRMQQEVRMTFVGSGIAYEYAQSSRAFERILNIDLDEQPEKILKFAGEYNCLINCLNFKVLELWDQSLPPQYFIDSLYWLWVATPPRIFSAKRYFVQNYIPNTVPTNISNAVPVPVIISPSIDGTRDPKKVVEGSILLNFAGCSNPILGSSYYKIYVDTLVRLIVELMDTSRMCTSLSICGNQELIESLANSHEYSRKDVIFMGHLPHDDFIKVLRTCQLFLTSPGQTATIEAGVLGVPIAFLLPQNYSQLRILELYRSFGFRFPDWLFPFQDTDLLKSEMPEEKAIALMAEILPSILESKKEVLKDLLRKSFETESAKVLSGQIQKMIQDHNGALLIAEQIIADLQR